MKKTLLTIVVLVVVVVGWMLSRNKIDVVVNNPTPIVSSTPTPLVSPESTVSPSPVISKNVIIYTDSGYTSSTLKIKKGETVVWKNQSSSGMWTASAVHPTHTVYPGTNLANCGTPAGSNQFDACNGIASGQSWSFKFDNLGTWGYHNHLNSSHTGKVVVE